MAARWLPNTREFFFSIASLIENAERQPSSASYDTSEFLLRRLDEYERTLSTLQSRVGETYSLFQALGSWGRAKTSEKKNEGGIRRGAAGEPVRLSLTTLFWYSRSCYTL